MKKLLGVTGCPTGIAHTYMAEEALKEAAKKLGAEMKVETNGAVGVENALTAEDIAECDGIIVACDKNVDMKRFNGKKVIEVSVSEGINKAEELVQAMLDGKAPVYGGSEAKAEVKEEAPVVEKQEERPAEEPKKARELAEVQPQTVEAVKTFLADTMKAMNMEVEIEISIDEDGALCADLRGEHMGILIGKRGQTLDSLQYLANRVANKHQDGYVRVKLDTENYRARREETLKHLAKNIAHKVKRNRRPVALEPMNPYERRIIHSALQSDPYVTTHSEGEEPYRKVVITLKR